MAYGDKSRDGEHKEEIPWALRLLSNQLGFKDPREFLVIVEQFKVEIPNVALAMKATMENSVKALGEIKAEMSQINGRLARLELHLGVDPTTPIARIGHDRRNGHSESPSGSGK